MALARRSLRPMPLVEPPLDPPARPAYESIPSTYVVCTDDRAIPASLQRVFAARANRVVEWDTSHSPFFSRPDLVANLLAERAAVSS